MANKILLTGATGFIGNQVLQNLQQTGTDITALIRPNTAKSRLKNFDNSVQIVEIDLCNIPELRKFLDANSFDTIIHIGALRGGRKASRKKYHLANVDASEQLMINSMQNNSKFIFCSSVGVFGAIPCELPANNYTKKQEDNFYHLTKIQSEKLLQKYVLHGLNGAIIRPAITYGIGDYGFPYTLIKLIDKKLLRLPDHDVTIHLTNVHILAQAFQKLMEIDFLPGSAFNVADPKPVKLHDLADFISREIHNKRFSDRYIIKSKWFELGERISLSLKNELWTARFHLISKSWYYDVEEAYKILNLKKVSTIPDIKFVIDWYLNKNKKKRGK
jgi:nucleoside-diphosphate-sugar epimerase